MSVDKPELVQNNIKTETVTLNFDVLQALKAKIVTLEVDQTIMQGA